MEVKEHESKDDVMNMLEGCCCSVVPFKANDIDSAHHTGLLYTDECSR